MAGKPPKTIQVGPCRWKVRFDGKMGDDFGTTAVEYQRITLNKNQSADSTREVLLHETLHALFNLTGLDKDLLAEADKIEETVIRRLSPALLAMLRDNPDLTAYLLA